jgi:hypothetical protein
MAARGAGAVDERRPENRLVAKSCITRSFRACGLSGTPHIHAMVKVRVIFKMKRVAEDDWQIEAHYPGAEIRHIKGLKSKADVDDWLQAPAVSTGSDRRVTRNDHPGHVLCRGPYPLKIRHSTDWGAYSAALPGGG